MRFRASSVLEAQERVRPLLSAMEADGKLVGDNWRADLQRVAGDIWEISIEVIDEPVAAPTSERLLLIELLERVKRLEAKLDRVLQKPFMA